MLNQTLPLSQDIFRFRWLRIFARLYTKTCVLFWYCFVFPAVASAGRNLVFVSLGTWVGIYSFMYNETNLVTRHFLFDGKQSNFISKNIGNATVYSQNLHSVLLLLNNKVVLRILVKCLRPTK